MNNVKIIYYSNLHMISLTLHMNADFKKMRKTYIYIMRLLILLDRVEFLFVGAPMNNSHAFEKKMYRTHLL